MIDNEHPAKRCFFNVFFNVFSLFPPISTREMSLQRKSRLPVYKDYLFLMCSEIAAHLPDPANVVATAVQCKNLNGAASLSLIIEALVCVSRCVWYTFRMHAVWPLTPRLSDFLRFFPNTCFKMICSDCWLLLCFSAPLLHSLSHVNFAWFICGVN